MVLTARTAPARIFDVNEAVHAKAVRIGDGSPSRSSGSMHDTSRSRRRRRRRPPLSHECKLVICRHSIVLCIVVICFNITIKNYAMIHPSKTKQTKTKQNKPKQNKTKQNKTKQNKMCWSYKHK
jgi:hypothetical protein